METNIEINIAEEKWQRELPLIEEVIQESCMAALKGSGIDANVDAVEISVMLACDVLISDLNKNYRSKNKPTNVLSFPEDKLYPGNYKGLNKELFLGDIIFAFETITKEASEQDKSFSDHFKHLLVHGTLHLLGYDHEKAKDAEEMESLEIKVLHELGVENPYKEDDI